MNVANAFVGLSEHKTRESLIKFRVGGLFTFQGAKSSSIAQLTNLHTYFMVGVHSLAHHTNLDVQTLFEYDVVKHTHGLLSSTPLLSARLNFKS